MHTILKKNMFCYDVIKIKNDEIIRRKEIDIYQKFKSYFLVFFFIWQKFDTRNVNFYLPTKKHF